MQATKNYLGDIETVIMGVGTQWRELKPGEAVRL